MRGKSKDNVEPLPVVNKERGVVWVEEKRAASLSKKKKVSKPKRERMKQNLTPVCLLTAATNGSSSLTGCLLEKFDADQSNAARDENHGLRSDAASGEEFSAQ